MSRNEEVKKKRRFQTLRDGANDTIAIIFSLTATEQSAAVNSKMRNTDTKCEVRHTLAIFAKSHGIVGLKMCLMYRKPHE